ncbi:MAG: hypothetical protein Q7S45_03525 [Candidatus Curtissbacteria bacterium]|nr:hypothetical protein [Candidatus Curtissbacteria bacterium]
MKSNLSKILLLIIVLYSVHLSTLLFKNYQGVDLSEPIFGTYRSDEKIFLKTYYLVKSGHSYYDSFQSASANDYANLKLGSDVFTWRLPTAFYIWSLTTTNGYQILAEYWVLAILFLVSVFLIIKKLATVNAGLLSVLLVLPYFAGNLSYKTSFLFIEWWALFFFTFGLTFFFYKKFVPAWILFFVAIAIRELMIIPILAFLILSLLLKKNRIFFATLILFSLIIFVLHAHFVLSRFPDTPQTSTILSRFHTPDKQSLLTMISFSMQNYPLTKYRINLLLIVLAFISLLANIKEKGISEKLYYYLAPWSMLLTFPFITTTLYNDYWGILFMPLLISTVSSLFSKQKT